MDRPQYLDDRRTGPIRSVLVSIAFLLLVASPLRAQVFPITDGAITTCSGALVDSGGEGGPGYGNNENITATVCPDQPGEGVSLNFVTFNLSPVGGAPVDRMILYDGATTADPIIGTFTGNQLQGQVVFASPTNNSGCITVQFISNGAGTGAFAASITCYTPCIPPTAIATVNESVPVHACVGEVFTFDGNGSYAAPGFSIVSMVWDLADGSTQSGAVVDHAFAAPGAYTVQLTVTDDNGCTNTNLVDLQVLVGTTPLFTGTVESMSVCQGATVDLSGSATSVTWNSTPVADFGDGVYLPDDVGQTFSSQLPYTSFAPGAVLTDINDLLSICVDVEHSFIGDLVISIACPNGQSVVMHQQNGGGTDLGVPVTGDENSPQPGTCWSYCWSPAATLGNWVQCSATGATPNVMNNGNGQSLIPATYSSLNNLNGLVGCPLNGAWTISFTDLWGLDNGFLCNWSMNFDPGLYPDLVEFTPVIGSTSDSIFWSGPGVSSNGSDPGEATASVPEPGSFEYQFSVTDNFGCTYDTTITITVTPAPVVDLTSTPGESCTDPEQLHADIVAYPPPLLSCDHTLVLNDSFDDIWQGGAQVNVVINGTSTTYALVAGGASTFTIAAPPGASIALVYTAGTQFNGENSMSFFGPAGNLLYNSPNGPLSGTLWSGTSNCPGMMGPVTYVWTPASGVDDLSSSDPLTTISSTTLFEVVVHPTGQPWCNTSDTITVAPPSFLENDSVITEVLCHGGDGSIEVLTSGAGGPWDYRWLDDQGQSVRNTIATVGDAYNGPAGTYTVIIAEGSNGNGCTDTLMATITEPDPLIWVGMSSDTLICRTGTAVLTAEAMGGTAPITYQWSGGPVGIGPHMVSPMVTRVYTVQALDINGCVTSTDTIMVEVRAGLGFDALTSFDQCSGVPFSLEADSVTGGDGNYTFTWSNGASSSPSMETTLNDDATICVTVSDGCETPVLSSCATITVLHSPPIVLSVDSSFGCAPFQVHLALQDTTAGGMITWDFGDGVTTPGPDVIGHIYPDPGTYDVSAIVTWPNGCTTDSTVTDMVQALHVPAPDFSWSPEPLTIFEPVAHFQELAGPNEVSYEWDFFEFGTSTEPDPVITFLSDQGRYYPVQLVVANELGCSDTIFREVHVEDVFLTYLPNAFSPDGDGINELFFVQGNDISSEDFEFLIFDRWGKEVFSSTDRYKPWNGRNGGGDDGEVLPHGVYVWRLKLRSAQTLQKRILSGHVTLLR
ncbi:MAG: gliding motility-associated C-terminal domain-containing protein [Flavobacteriales bacterium]|nr:gliding motility-associated C-terminal domain-containing protein [Flavobacteriales bacterium]